MLKLLLILLIGLTCESTGIVFLKKGMTQVGEVNSVTVSEVARIIKAGVTNTNILLGVFFQALFFACLLLLMSKSDISFLWPLTGLSFVFATLAARLFLNEHVTPLRWVGIVLIVFGAGIISYTEHLKKQSAPAPAAAMEPDRH